MTKKPFALDYDMCAPLYKFMVDSVDLQTSSVIRDLMLFSEHKGRTAVALAWEQNISSFMWRHNMNAENTKPMFHEKFIEERYQDETIPYFVNRYFDETENDDIKLYLKMKWSFLA